MASKAKQNKTADQNKEEKKIATRGPGDSKPQTVTKHRLANEQTENSPPNRDIAYTWTQNENDVKIVFSVGKRLTDKDIDAEFTDEDASLKLSDGRTWKCKFSKPVVKEISRVKLAKKQVIVQVAKKIQNEHWDTLEYVEHVAEPDTPAATQTEEKTSTSEENKLDEKMEVEETVAGGPGGDSQKAEEKPTYNLSMVKNDWYEKGLEAMVVYMYVRNLKKDDLQVDISSKHIAVTFQTNCRRFLSLHQGTTEDTHFKWEINLVDEIDTSTAKFKVTASGLEINLRKKEFRRWGMLEAPQHKEKKPATKPPPSPNTWVSTAKSTGETPNKPVETPQNPTETTSKPPEAPVKPAESSKVIFDDMEDFSEKPSIVDLEDSPSTSRGVSRDKETTSQKPTCMVSPLNKENERAQVVPPGMTGLENLGNTCFMNSVLQVLANTRELRDYFLDGSFQKDINPENPLGTGGRLAVSFAVLMKVLWSGKYRSYAPAKLKTLVAMKASQFTGFAQHDAQEFMAFLLDGLHEDVNRIKKKPYTETVDSDGRPDELVANEAWSVHKKRNDSFFVDLFQGQFKSKLVCPLCGKVSITFDPFMILPVPLPKKQRLMPVIFISRDPYRKPVRYMLQMAKDAVVEQLKEAVWQKTGISPKNLRVFEAYKNRILKHFGKGESLANVAATDKIVVCEVLSDELAGEPVLEIAVLQRTLLPHQAPTKCSFCRRECKPCEKLKRCTKCFRAAYCDQECQRNDWHQKHRTMCRQSPEPVGWPFIISVPESQATFARLAQLMEAYARYSVDVFQPPVIQDPIPPSPSATNSTPSDQGDDAPSNLRRSSTASSTLTSSSSNVSEVATESSCVSSMSGSEQNLFAKASSPDDTSTSGSSSADSSTLKEVSSREHSGDSEGSLSPVVSPSTSSDNLHRDYLTECNTSTEVNQGTSPNPPLLSQPSSSVLDTGDKAEPTEGVEAPGRVPPTRLVMGRPKDQREGQSPNFYIRPCDKDGKTIPGEDGARFEDKGEEPLDLTNRYCLAMDWKNNDKFKSYVLVQSKELDVEDDSSMHTMNLAENSSFTLEQCLTLFTEPEVLSPEHAWYCPQCKEHREATKQMSIWRLPNTLIIQLKRFSFRNLIWRDKIDKMVEFPTRGLDLSKFFIGSQPVNEPPPIYDLYGVVNHHGGLLGGHYTSYGRCANLTDWKTDDVGWRLFDDSMVSHTSEKQVVTRAAYVLFYRRRHVSLPAPRPAPSTLAMEEQEVKENNQSSKCDQILSTNSREEKLDLIYKENMVNKDLISMETDSTNGGLTHK